MVVDYKSRKNEVLDSYETAERLVSELQAYAASIKLPDPTERLAALLSDIRNKAEKVRADRFSIMVAGEAKSGKSTFINAYLGVDLLPMDVKQCTSAILEIKYGKVFSVRATYADGRQTEYTDETEARDFLKKNAALDDEYRNIPVPTINSEILVKSGLRAKEKGIKIKILSAEVEAMLQAPEVKAANIHSLPDYNDRIKAYIEAKKDTWYDIVTKIEIMFPFGDDLRGIEIIDSPGVCARGGVAEITSHYIDNADAIIFLKSIIGQSLESTQFTQFMETTCVERNKEALFLVMTYIAALPDADVRRLEIEAYKQFSDKLSKRNILFVDSKAELHSKWFSNVDNIEAELRRMKKEGSLDPFVLDAYEETNGLFGEGDDQDFIQRLHEVSRFESIYKALDQFGRKAHYILLASLLGSISKLYNKLWNDMNSRIELFRQKAEDPAELERKIAKINCDLEIIQYKSNEGIKKVTRKFRGDEGLIRSKAEETQGKYVYALGQIDPDSSEAFAKLESRSLGIIEQYKTLKLQIQNQVIKEFDRELLELSDKESISFEELQPTFTEETFKQIEEATRRNATEMKPYETGGCFRRTKYRPVYVQSTHFKLIKNNIMSRIDGIKADLIGELESYVEGIRVRYSAELAQNASAQKAKMDAIMKKKLENEQIVEIIQKLEEAAERLNDARIEVDRIKGGIGQYVQRKD